MNSAAWMKIIIEVVRVIVAGIAGAMSSSLV